MEATTDEPIEKRIPAKSSAKYAMVYDTFMKWHKKNDKKLNDFSEDVMLEYFRELSTKMKPPTLWCIYSMLNRTIGANHDISINHPNLMAFIKKQSVGYKCRETKALSINQITKFLTEAPDDIYLATKVALIFGINGACRKDELTNLTIDDIEEHGRLLLVRIRNTETTASRAFTIDEEYVDLVKKYRALRPRICGTSRFFVNFQNGKCTIQPIGKNKFGRMPKQIAQYLNLADAELYTGHTFRRTSANLLADVGPGRVALRRHGLLRRIEPKPDEFASVFIKEETDVEDMDIDDLDDKLEIDKLLAEAIRIDSSGATSTSKVTGLTDDDDDDDDDESPASEEITSLDDIEQPVTTDTAPSDETQSFAEAQQPETTASVEATKPIVKITRVKLTKVNETIKSREVTTENVVKTAPTVKLINEKTVPFTNLSDKMITIVCPATTNANNPTDKTKTSTLTIPEKNLTLNFTNCTNINFYFNTTKTKEKS